jgi:hypothetical protein
VHINGEEVSGAHALLTNNFPLRYQRLAACCPCLVCRLDAAGVEAQGWATDDLGLVERAAWVGLVETNKRGLVQIRDANVASGRASVLVVHRSDIDEGVVRPSGRADSLSESAQRKVCGYDWTTLVWVL